MKTLQRIIILGLASAALCGCVASTGTTQYRQTYYPANTYPVNTYYQHGYYYPNSYYPYNRTGYNSGYYSNTYQGRKVYYRTNTQRYYGNGMR